MPIPLEDDVFPAIDRETDDADTAEKTTRKVLVELLTPNGYVPLGVVTQEEEGSNEGAGAGGAK